MEQRERWASKAGFILAAVGSAIGLGNIWRYPYVVYENGGGAFLIPYFVALLTAGIPILLLEYVIGHKYKASPPFGFRKIRRGAEWIGWWQVIVAFFVITYYMAILGWALSYTYYSFGTQWGEDTEGFFFNHYLSISEGFWGFGGIQWKVLIPFVIVWAVTYWIMQRGVSRGIEVANKILMPVLIAMMIIITIRGVTLPGAAEGLNVLFTPDFGALADPKVWVQAYGHVFFSLSIAFAIMITYSSYLPDKTDLTNSGLIAGLANSGFEFMAAIGVFATLGFLAAAAGGCRGGSGNGGGRFGLCRLPAGDQRLSLLEFPVRGAVFRVASFRRVHIGHFDFWNLLSPRSGKNSTCPAKARSTGCAVSLSWSDCSIRPAGGSVTSTWWTISPTSTGLSSAGCLK